MMPAIPPFHLRDAGFADHAAIALLHAESWRRTYRGMLADAYLDGPVFADRAQVWRERLARAPQADCHVVLATAGERPIGFVCASLDSDPAQGVYLDNLHVAHDAQGRGLGRRLLEDAERWTRARGRTRMWLLAFERNAGARAVYENLGWIVDGHLDEEVPGGGVCRSLRYVKMLGPAAGAAP